MKKKHALLFAETKAARQHKPDNGSPDVFHKQLSFTIEEPESAKPDEVIFASLGMHLAPIPPQNFEKHKDLQENRHHASNITKDKKTRKKRIKKKREQKKAFKYVRNRTKDNTKSAGIMSILSFALGLLSILLIVVGTVVSLLTPLILFGVLLGLLALVFGIISLVRTKGRPRAPDKGWAITGIVLGGLPLLLILIALTVLLYNLYY